MNTKSEILLDQSQDILAEAEQLLVEASQAGGKDAEALYARAVERLRSAKTRLVEVEQVAVAKAKQAAKVTDEYVHDHPWQAIGVAAAVGALVGMLISRR
jgi:ElaB/YqjD/DUF883 family membrane-anchored ribosome-binding protein